MRGDIVQDHIVKTYDNYLSLSLSLSLSLFLSLSLSLSLCCIVELFPEYLEQLRVHHCPWISAGGSSPTHTAGQYR